MVAASTRFQLTEVIFGRSVPSTWKGQLKQYFGLMRAPWKPSSVVADYSWACSLVLSTQSKTTCRINEGLLLLLEDLTLNEQGFDGLDKKLAAKAEWVLFRHDATLRKSGKKQRFMDARAVLRSKLQPAKHSSFG